MGLADKHPDCVSLRFTLAESGNRNQLRVLLKIGPGGLKRSLLFDNTARPLGTIQVPDSNGRGRVTLLSTPAASPTSKHVSRLWPSVRYISDVVFGDTS